MTAGVGPRVLFVCEGNICRSPYAMVSFEERWKASSRLPAESRSLGTRATPGVPAHEQLGQFFVAEASRERLVSHRSERLTPLAVRAADLVVTMERAQRGAVLTAAPSMLHRTFMLDELARVADAVAETDRRPSPGTTLRELVGLHRLAIGTPEDVADPMGGSAGDFADMAHTIDEALGRILPLLLALGWGARG